MIQAVSPVRKKQVRFKNKIPKFVALKRKRQVGVMTSAERNPWLQLLAA
jgi:hypothetical protein